ncbi:divergent polysaccharide deacetylase family protein [Deferribacter thermophilus]|uniref:divergent polysaccharide deacetylase family protein n=1 Tax=Deferribacter thermophilus TaxID=53573 RepID=UPI003C141755
MATKKKRTNKRKKRQKKVPPTVIVGGIFFVLILLIIIVTLRIKVENVKSNIVSKQNKLIQIENIKKDIKTLFFDLEIDKSSVKESILYKNNKVFLNYKITTDNSEFLYTLSTYLSQNDYKNISLNKNLITAQKGNILLQFYINNISHKDNIKNAKKILPKNHNKEKKLAIIIDDCGNNLKLAEKLASIPYPITFSIIPFLKYSKETADLARKNNKVVFLHLPMQPKSYPSVDPGMGAIFLNTPKSLIEIILKKDVESIGVIDGANNHMGSALTENRVKMNEVLKELKKYTKVFVDSHTSSKTVAYNVCKNLKMKCGINNKFIDNIDDKSAIKEMLYKALELFEKRNEVIIIGHLKENTVEVLSQELPNIARKNIKIVSILEVVN